MTEQTQKVIQYLNEAHATEMALIQTLQAHIAMTPSGGYRTGLERHLRETHDHAERVERRLGELGEGRNRLQAGVGAIQGLLGQVLALSKGPLDLVRGGSGEEKLLKNAKDECATEALEIATYTALERLAANTGDDKTAKLAASIRTQEQRMLDRLLAEIPKLTDAVVRSEIEGRPSFDPSTTGAADTVREAGEAVKETAQKANRRGRSAARQARKVPGVARAEGQVKGAAASEEDLPIAGYNDLNADDVVKRLTDLSQIDLAKVGTYERKFQNRRTIVSKIDSLQGDEPWPGYDELSVDDVTSALSAADDQRLSQVKEYERRHKDRAGVIRATERESSRS